MPENDEQDISVGAQAPVETERERFERERLSRRQALKKFGITSAMATFAMFSVDDLARMVGKAMQQRAADNKVVEQVAQEFQKAGVAMADTSGSGSQACVNCGTTKQHCLDQALADFNTCVSSRQSTRYCDNLYSSATSSCRYSYADCCHLNNCNCGV